MNRFKVISLDMFQTLVDVDSRIEQIWMPILDKDFSVENAKRNAKALLAYFFLHWDEARSSGDFVLMKEVYGKSMVSLFNESGIRFDSRQALRILFREHQLCHLFDDTLEFLEDITGKYQVCIVSDADDDMVPDFYRQYNVKLFTSEQHRSYKNDAKNHMFKEIIKYYNVQPHQILHIGDSKSDILGAGREGIVTCWLNRNNSNWDDAVQPDYIITSLNELEATIHRG